MRSYFEQFFSFHFLHFPFYFCRNQSHCMPGISKNLIISHSEIYSFFGGSLSLNLSEFSFKKFSPGKINWALAFAPEGRTANGNAYKSRYLLEHMMSMRDHALFWFQKIPKTKISHVTLRVLGGRVPALQNFLRWGRGPHRYK